MATPTNSQTAVPPAPPPVEQVLARLLRHEIGDLLQTVYSAVAILQDRVPPQGLERQLLGFLKGRAETCRLELDAAVDLVCPLNLRLGTVDLTALTGSLVPLVREQFPERQIDLVASDSVIFQGDGARLSLCLQLLLRGIAQAAVRQVRVQLTGGPEEAVWSVQRDGPPLNDEQKGWLDRPFSTTRHGLLGLGLALARRIAEWHGGRVRIESPAEGGALVSLLLPTATPTCA